MDADDLKSLKDHLNHLEDDIGQASALLSGIRDRVESVYDLCQEDVSLHRTISREERTLRDIMAILNNLILVRHVRRRMPALESMVEIQEKIESRNVDVVHKAEKIQRDLSSLVRQFLKE
jgi:hypothetical protein